MMTILSSKTMNIPDGVKIKFHAKIIKVKDNPILDGNEFFSILCPDQLEMPSCIAGSFLMLFLLLESSCGRKYIKGQMNNGETDGFKYLRESCPFVITKLLRYDITKPRTTLPVKADNKKKVVMLKTPEPVKIPELYEQIYNTIVLSVKS
ncbi:hypothetical protein D8674_011668 [Pyrus ussuriensis x Pyrus communis]|uniref:Uncharacterized protein n=1 Tax=Pyrus ussuriensis x Pyrus communis TaxID=2448454 RepID=A0A5N5G480_9ROSA|nr:hypothetical protein D8674_011668 [Pyrus ussuriensis x Pyrus communis]